MPPPQSSTADGVYKQKEFAPMINWIYDLILWSFSVLVDLFFREVHPRGSFRIPRRGPVIFVAAPHANQFVDPLILMRAVRLEAKRRIAFLVAEKSMRRRFIGWLSRSVGALPVARALDMTKPASGRIYLPDPSTPNRIRGIGTKFETELSVGGLLVLPSIKGKTTASAEVVEIVDNEEVLLKREFKEKHSIEQLTYDGDDGRGTKFKIAPKVDQSQVYDAVFQRLNAGGCVGIFPEGGSHDRTELLPLKAGVAIMALGALAANPECGLKIVPCGLNYFHAHKFRSRAVIEFGSPIDVPMELVKQYAKGERREAVRILLEMIYNSLVSVTVTSPDYDTLMVIQAARRLYKPSHKKLPLPTVMELNRRLVTGYTHFKDNPNVVKLRANVTEYNRQLRLLGLRDHQVEYAKFSVPQVLGTLIYRLLKIPVLALGALPGVILFAPVFIATKQISRQKAKEALKASTVKIQGRDVMATWKLLVALAFAPIVYSFYVAALLTLTYKHRFWGLIPQWVPLWLVSVMGWVVFPTITFAALRFGEVGMDIVKSLRPLVLLLNPTSANTLSKLKKRREELIVEVTSLINSLGPELFPDFDSARIVADPFAKLPGIPAGASRDNSNNEPHQYGLTYTTNYDRNTIPKLTRRDSEHSTATEDSHDTSSHGGIPRNESFGNLANIALFASRPVSRARSRSNSGRGESSLFGRLCTLDDNYNNNNNNNTSLGVSSGTGVEAAGDDVVRRIKSAMAERGRQRGRRRRSEGGYEGEEQGEEQGEEGGEEGEDSDGSMELVENEEGEEERKGV